MRSLDAPVKVSSRPNIQPDGGRGPSTPNGPLREAQTAASSSLAWAPDQVLATGSIRPLLLQP
eukprot:7472899-Alexandrium_andersonii.AAC.1